MARSLPALLVALLLLGPGCGVGSIFEPEAAVPSGGSGTSEAMSAGERTWAFEILDLVNAERAGAGLGPLAWSEGAAEAAYGHSLDMHYRDFFAHENPDGAGLADRLRAAGVEFGLAGENIAKGYDGPADVMRAWMASDGHRANILEARFTHVGIGIHSTDGDGPWWTQDFYR